MAKRESFKLLWISGIVLVLLIAGGVMFFKPSPSPGPGPGPKPDPVPVRKDPAILIELATGYSARQAVDRLSTIQFFDDDDHDDTRSRPVFVTFPEGSPCQSDPSQGGSVGICAITSDAEERPYKFKYCKDPAGTVNNCASLISGEIRVRDHTGKNELNNTSAPTVYLGLTKYGQINHFVKAGDIVKWADRNHAPLQVLFKSSVTPMNPCGIGDGTPIDTCSIQNELDDDYDYDCAAKSCSDPTLHVRPQYPTPPSPTGSVPNSTN